MCTYIEANRFFLGAMQVRFFFETLICMLLALRLLLLVHHFFFSPPEPSSSPRLPSVFHRVFNPSDESKHALFGRSDDGTSMQPARRYVGDLHSIFDMRDCRKIGMSILCVVQI